MELSGAISTIGVGTNATTAPPLPSSKPLGVDAPATSTPAPAGTQDGTYMAINMYRRQAGTALNLLGGAQCRSSTTGSIFNGNPDRHKMCHSRWDFAKKLNIMLSFDTVELECSCCSEHKSSGEAGADKTGIQKDNCSDRSKLHRDCSLYS